MRRRKWIKRVRTLSLAMLIASVGLWVVSEFRNVGATGLQLHIWMDRGAINFQYLQGKVPAGVTVENWALAKRWRGLHFPQFRYACFHYIANSPHPSYLIKIPFWSTSLVALGVWLRCTVLLLRMKPFPGMCPHCGYDASRCTEGRCSECGEALPAPTQVDAPA